ncbi:unnamed protein product [Soboliphyme baturini]|uniref:RICTOR_V domain-containing protein n=1 Tax=Soboliphyme baturini TaxID=241478 RepID=A0A183IYT6_9BILA|nr:unnamed protein product [Soboliphyme baturini]
MLVSGRLPFQEANDSETLTKILDCSFSLPGHVSDGCRKYAVKMLYDLTKMLTDKLCLRLIESMLVRNPSQRASLMEIAQCGWVKAGATGHSCALPLIIRENITEELHNKIMNLMVTGSIADVDHITKSLENNDYNHVTATYYLLAERFLRDERLKQAQKLSSPSREESEEEAEDQNSSDSSASNSIERFGSTSSRESSFFINKRGSSYLLHDLSLDLDLASQSSRASVTSKGVHEPTDSRNMSPLDDRISPLLQRYRGHGSASSRKLTGIASSPQLLEISEEEEENGARLLKNPGCSSLIRNGPTDDIGLRDKALHPSRRSASCSSSETSDDEERRLGFVTSHLVKKDFDTDDDSDPPSSSGINAYSRVPNVSTSKVADSGNGIRENDHRTMSSGSGGGKETKSPGQSQTGRPQVVPRMRGTFRRYLDTVMLSAKYPFVTTFSMLCELNDWTKPLMKPRSCEFLQNIRYSSFTAKPDYKSSSSSLQYHENSEKSTQSIPHPKSKSRRFALFVEASRIWKNGRFSGNVR